MPPHFLGILVLANVLCHFSCVSRDIYEESKLQKCEIFWEVLVYKTKNATSKIISPNCARVTIPVHFELFQHFKVNHQSPEFILSKTTEKIALVLSTQSIENKQITFLQSISKCKCPTFKNLYFLSFSLVTKNQISNFSVYFYIVVAHCLYLVLNTQETSHFY